MAGAGGGSWKVAYADFVTAMMAFFMVMWITAQNVEVKESVAHYFQHPFPFRMGSDGPTLLPPTKGSQGEGGPGGIRNDADGKKRRIAKATPEKKQPGAAYRQKSHLFVLHDGKQPTKGTVVQFAESSDVLTNEAKDLLEKTSLTMLGLPNKIEIRGHSTRRPLPPGSPFQDAWQLAYARCVATMDLLVKLGIEPERIRLSQAGPFEPQTIDPTPDWQKINSRVEVFLLDELAEDLLGTKEERTERVQGAPTDKAEKSGLGAPAKKAETKTGK